MGTDGERRQPIPGLSSDELRETEIEVLRERRDKLVGKSGKTGELLKSALALLRAELRDDPALARNGITIRLEEPGIDDNLDVLDHPMFD